FGAVVDPSLKGKVKITVIATGFGAHVATRPHSSSMQTPVDLVPFTTEAARLRVDPSQAPSVTERTAGRLTIARRPPVDVPSSIPVPNAAAAGYGYGAPGSPTRGTDQSAADGE